MVLRTIPSSMVASSDSANALVTTRGKHLVVRPRIAMHMNMLIRLIGES